MNIIDPIVAHAQARPSAAAIVHGDRRTLSYADLARVVENASARCVAAGIGPGDAAIVDTENLAVSLVLTLALARMGAAAAPRSHPPSLASAWIGGSNRRPPGPWRRVLRLDASWLDPSFAGPETPPPVHRDPAAIAVIHASAGTTGLPKSMPVTHARMRRRIEIARAGVPQPGDARVLTVSGVNSGYGTIKCLRALWDGAAMVLPPNRDDAVAAILRHRVTHLAVMPAWIERILAGLPAGARPAPSLVQVEFGGSFLPRPLYDALRERLGCEVYCVYGATEIGFAAAGAMSELALHDRAVGRVLPGVAVEAIDEDRRPLPPGAEGRLRVRSDGMASGYAGDPALSAETFVDGWVLTSDIGSVSADGLVRLSGRLRDLLNIGGATVAPQPIEDALLTVRGIRDAAVFGMPGATGITEIWAAVVSDSPVDLGAVEAAMRAARIGTPPRFVLPVPAIPRNDDGKILRDRLSAAAAATRPGAGRR